MYILPIVILLIVVAVLLWALNKYLGPVMDKTILTIINLVVVLAAIVVTLKYFGLLDYIAHFKV